MFLFHWVLLQTIPRNAPGKLTAFYSNAPVLQRHISSHIRLSSRDCHLISLSKVCPITEYTNPSVIQDAEICFERQLSKLILEKQELEWEKVWPDRSELNKNHHSVKERLSLCVCTLLWEIAGLLCVTGIPPTSNGIGGEPAHWVSGQHEEGGKLVGVVVHMSHPS